jgi:hypothetical protein
MTARQPRNFAESSIPDLLGVISAPQRSGGILFGRARRRQPFQTGVGGMNYGADQTAPGVDMASPPPISSAPPPPANWPELVGDLPATIGQADPYADGSGSTGLPTTTLPSPLPRRRSGMFGASVGAVPQGLPTAEQSGSLRAPPGAWQGALGSLSKIGNHDVTLGEALDGGMSKGKKGGFDWNMAAGVLGDALLGLNGQAAIYGPAMWKLRQQREEHSQRLAEMQEQNRLKLAEPDYATINNRLVRFTPGTGESDVVFTAPQDFEDYAATLGAEPGSPEYDRLVQDYVLRGGGPTATDNYNLREDWRQKNREELEGIRQSNRSALEGQRQAGRRALKAIPTYGQANPRPRSVGAGNSGGVREGQTATNPQTGAKVVYRGGKWVPAR